MLVRIFFIVQLKYYLNQDELDTLKREQEDLLVLLMDQDTKLGAYRKRLMELGESITDDEDEELELPDDDDDDDDEDLK